MKNLHLIDQAWKIYRDSEKTQQDKALVLNAVKEDPEGYWSIAFSEDKTMCHQIRLVQNEQYAKQALKEYQEAEDSVKLTMLELTTLQAWSLSKNDDNKVNDEILNIWKDVFQETNFVQTMQQVQENLKKSLANRI